MSAPGPLVLPRRLARILRALAIVLLTCALAAAQQLWYASYQQGVEAFRRNEYALAKRKFVDAVTNPHAPKSRGRRMQYYGLQRDKFIPEYYLALIAAQEKQWNEALRYVDAAEPYMRGDKDFDTLMVARAAATNALGSRPTSTTPAAAGATTLPATTIKPEFPGSTASTTTSPSPADTRAVLERQAASFLAQANAALEGG